MCGARIRARSGLVLALCRKNIATGAERSGNEWRQGRGYKSGASQEHSPRISKKKKKAYIYGEDFERKEGEFRAGEGGKTRTEWQREREREGQEDSGPGEREAAGAGDGAGTRK